MIQSTLTGGQTDESRIRPETFMWCPETSQWILRSLRANWPHELYESPDAVPSLDEETIHTSVNTEDDDDEVMEVGGVYEITLSYSVDYTFSVPAVSEAMAKERAEDLKLDAHPSSSHQVYTRKRKSKTLYEDDDMIPDDWDPYGSTPLWMAIEEAEGEDK